MAPRSPSPAPPLGEGLSPVKPLWRSPENIILGNRHDLSSLPRKPRKGPKYFHRIPKLRLSFKKRESRSPSIRGASDRGALRPHGFASASRILLSGGGRGGARRGVDRERMAVLSLQRRGSPTPAQGELRPPGRGGRGGRARCVVNNLNCNGKRALCYAHARG